MLETTAAAVQDKIGKAVPAAEEVLIRASTDMEADGRFGRQWLVATATRVVVVPEREGAAVQQVALTELCQARTEPMVGGGQLELECRDAPTVYLPYSGSEGSKFSEIARGLEQLRQGEPLVINAHVESLRCEKCERLLPEKDGICPACISRTATLKRIAHYLKPYKGKTAFLALASLVTTGAELLPPLITARIIDEVFEPQDMTLDLEGRGALLGLLVLGLIGVRLLSWVAEWGHGWVVSWLGAQVTADIRSQLYRRLEMLSLQFYDRRRVGSLISRMTRDASRLQEFLVDGLPYLVINGLMLLGILGFMFWMSWSLTIYVLLPIPLLIVWGIVFWKRMRRFFGKWGEAWSKITERTSEVLTGIRVVKAFAQEKREMKGFDRDNAQMREVAVKTAINRGVFFATMSFLTGLGTLVVWFFGGREVLFNDMTPGTLIAFYSYMWLVYGPMEWFGQVNSWMTRAFAGAERVFEIIDTEPEGYDDPQALAMPQFDGRISFQGVSFGYDKSKPVLHNITMEVAAGEMVGLVGKSGVGKTTTINLIARFYDVDHGAICIDGVDVRRIRLEDLRQQIGIVLQEPVLFSGTIVENIGYGNPRARFAEIMRAARAANAHEFIMAKPDGYDTQVGEQGIGLSGGERQRIAIARAILHDPKILVLDEATSSVDVQTEKMIQAAIGHMVEGRTTIAIAHRLSTLSHADRLILLDDGRIVEEGTHAELMERQGAFCDLVKMQQEVAEIMAVGD